ncbi:Cullin-1 [Acorus gramineus]|uniref:Cullin-1 n=1 Tax=Acorus gramineus TaxID=55184 RepID=A0AAV9BV06_ACOGR|nr:Cullin-1 [Acorus gramineus]
MEVDHIDWEEGWAIMEEAMMKLTNLLEGFPETQFTSADYMRFYQYFLSCPKQPLLLWVPFQFSSYVLGLDELRRTAYQMCIQKPPHDYSALLYERFRTSIEDYVADKVLPSLREKQGEDLLRDFARRWTNHRELVRRLSRFLAYLDRYFVEKRKLPKLVDAGTVIFEELVYNEMKLSVTNVLISMTKACLNEEKERAAYYMHSTSASKLEERVHHELYKAPETILEKKKCKNDT